MLRHLHLKDVGPSRDLEFEFAPRLNVLTGDNGLGKSFVLDVAWWALTGGWSGEKAFPWRPATSVDPGPISPQISGTAVGSTTDEVGYTVMWKPDDETVDHFVPWTELRGTENAWRAYDWDNLRLAVGWFNCARRGPIPDPYLVEDSWFALRLPSLELEATEAVPAAVRAAVDNVLRWLRDDRRVMKPRREWFRMYREGELSFAGLLKKAPLIAAALRRQPEFLSPADRERSQAGDL